VLSTDSPDFSKICSAYPKICEACLERLTHFKFALNSKFVEINNREGDCLDIADFESYKVRIKAELQSTIDKYEVQSQDEEQQMEFVGSWRE